MTLPGQGATAQRLIRRLLPLVKTALSERFPDRDFSGITNRDFSLWVQPPAKRGPRWDLTPWGGRVRHPSIPAGEMLLSSWETMGSLLKHDHKLTVSWERGLELDVH